MAEEIELLFDDAPEIELLFDGVPDIELVFDETPVPKPDLRMGGPLAKELGWERAMRERAEAAVPEYRKIILDPLKGFLAKGVEIGTFLAKAGAVYARDPKEFKAITGIKPEEVGKAVGKKLGADVEVLPFKAGKFVGEIAEVALFHRVSAGQINKLRGILGRITAPLLNKAPAGKKVVELSKPMGNLVERMAVDFGAGASLAVAEEKKLKEIVLDGLTWATIGGALGVPSAVRSTTKLVRDRAGKWAVKKTIKAPKKVPIEVPVAPLPADIVNKLRTKIREARPLRVLQEEVKRDWRRRQIAELKAIPKHITGLEREIEEKLVFKKFGTMPKVDFTPLDVTPAEQDAMINIIDAHFSTASPTFMNRFPTKSGLGKLFGQHGGAVPTENELALLGEVFGKGLVRDVLAKRSTYAKMAELGYEVANLPRAIMASFDMSAPLRQAIFLAPRHPRLFLKNFFKMHRYFFSENAFKDAMGRIAERETYPLMLRAKVPLTKAGGAFTQAEESFMTGGLGEWIPWTTLPTPLRMSNRAHVGFLNSFRADIFDSIVNDTRKMGRNIDNDVLLESMGDFIGSATGRGRLGKTLEGTATLLNTLLFSPRLISSRLNLINPRFYHRLDPLVRKEALKTLFAWLSAGTTVLGLAHIAGAEVGLNPYSADFGKVKIGDTRIDIWGGFQQYAVFAARMIGGLFTSSTTGRTRALGEGYKPTTRLTLAGRAFRSKLAPTASFVTDWMAQQGEAGEPFNVRKAAAERVTPMVMGDAIDVLKSDPELLWTIPLGFYGTGIQTYE